MALAEPAPILIQSVSPAPISIHEDDDDSESEDDRENLEKKSPTPKPSCCVVCFRNFNDSDRSAINLRCEHTVCLTCAKRLWMINQSCPVCRQHWARNIFHQVECQDKDCEAEDSGVFEVQCGTRFCGAHIMACMTMIQRRGRPYLAYRCPNQSCSLGLVFSHGKKIIF